ncbi:MAG: hypothetical protein M1133_09315 [Armatimonadetes bacterium]|nr:hypothetical protein [Armatimonadota bacterium]
MGEIAATVTDALDSRMYECLLPDDEQLSSLALRLADMLQFPVVGPDNCPLDYGFIVKGGDLLDPDSDFAELNPSKPIVLRLVPVLVAGSDSTETPALASPASPRQRTMLSSIKAIEIDPPDEFVDIRRRFDVRMDASVHREIGVFACGNPNIECAGLLLGEIGDEHGERVTHITAIAPATKAVGTRTSVKMTLHAWESALLVRDREYPELGVVGWFHTHAGWGVFMSESDVFIHRHFFSNQNMVAYVLDPTVGRDGFFCWHDGSIGLCPSFGLVCMPEDIRHPESRWKPGRICWSWLAGVAGCVALAVGLFFAIPRLVHPVAAPEEHPAPVVRAKPLASTETDIIVTISGGESLWGLCSQTYGDGSLAPALAKYNRIGVRSTLSIGQTIKLPPREMLRKMQP